MRYVRVFAGFQEPFFEQEFEGFHERKCQWQLFALVFLEGKFMIGSG